MTDLGNFNWDRFFAGALPRWLKYHPASEGQPARITADHEMYAQQRATTRAYIEETNAIVEAIQPGIVHRYHCPGCVCPRPPAQ